MFYSLLLALFALHFDTSWSTRLRQAPVYGMNHPSRLPNIYSVIFKHDDYTTDEHWLATGTNLSSSRNFHPFLVLSGYIAEMNSTALHNIRRDLNVKYIQADRMVQTASDTGFTSDSHYLNESQASQPFGKLNSIIDVSDPRFSMRTQRDAPWNLAVIGARGRLATPVTDHHQYYSIKDPGLGVNIYIFDGGMHVDNPFFGGRAKNFGGADHGWVPSSDPPPFWHPKPEKPGQPRPPPPDMYDASGHGTAIASVAGANDIGVASSSTLVNVKVGSEEETVPLSVWARAVDEVIAKHLQDWQQFSDDVYRGSVILITLAPDHANPGTDQVTIDAFNRAWASGIDVIAGAGNLERGEIKTEEFWPCGLSSVICVGGINDWYEDDSRSNHGRFVDYLAPAENVVVLDAFSTIPPFTKHKSGTSVAAPHIAGIAAIFRSWRGRSEVHMKDYLAANALRNIVTGVSNDQPNLLGNTGILNSQKNPDEPFRLANRC